MFNLKNIAIGLLIACCITLIILFMQGSTEIFIYNRF